MLTRGNRKAAAGGQQRESAAFPLDFQTLCSKKTGERGGTQRVDLKTQYVKMVLKFKRMPEEVSFNRVNGKHHQFEELRRQRAGR